MEINSIEMNQESQCLLKDVVLEILQIIMNAADDAELRKDVMNYFSSQTEDIFHVFKFMIFSKSKEELQTKVVRYMIARQPLLFEFLEKLSSEKHCKEMTEDLEDIEEKQSSSSIEKDDKRRTKKVCGKNKAIKQANDADNKVLKGQRKSTCTGKESEPEENEGERPKKRRRSKYDYIYLQGDLSHICREPKSSRTDKTRNESHGRINAAEKCKMEKDFHDSTTSNDESLSGAIKEVKSMIDTLTKPSSNQSREEVLGVLRSDPSVRQVFMREKERLGKQKIPIFTYSKKQGLEERNSFFKHNDTETVEDKRSADWQDTISFLLGAISQNASEDKYEDVHKMDFLHEEAQEAFPNIFDVQPEQNSSDISHFVVANSSEETSAIVDSTTYTQIPCSSDSAGDRHIVNEMLLDQTKTIIDNALHEHFQQLSREQFSINNAHLLSDNEAMHL